MSNCHQIIWKGRKKQYTKKRGRALLGCPQKKRTCIKALVRSPRKPNSAVRKIARVCLISTMQKIYRYLPGVRSHIPVTNATIYIRGGRVRDLPGVLYHAMPGRGQYACGYRYNARSKYGTKKL